LSAIQKFEKRTRLVVIITAVTMVVEIIAGSVTKSMALLADGIHMGSHVMAIGLSWGAYILVRRLNEKGNKGLNQEKILSLSGYTSGLLLLIFALFIMVQAIERLLNPLEIAFREAIIVAFIGLIVNIVSAFLLHHDKAESDHNIKAAYLHVIADAFTSISAIAGLTAAMIWNISYVDSAAAVISSIVIIKWATGLLRDSGRVLIETREEK
jgi:cation diffusion facilitator family transporter